MEGLEIPEDLRAKLMAHLGVSGKTSITKIVSRSQIHDKYHHNSGMFIVQWGWVRFDMESRSIKACIHHQRTSLPRNIATFSNLSTKLPFEVTVASM